MSDLSSRSALQSLCCNVVEHVVEANKVSYSVTLIIREEFRGAIFPKVVSDRCWLAKPGKTTKYCLVAPTLERTHARLELGICSRES